MSEKKVAEAISDIAVGLTIDKLPADAVDYTKTLVLDVLASMIGTREIVSSRIAAELVSSGIDVMDVSGGLGGIAHPDRTGQGFLIPEAEQVGKAASVPVIGVGGITEPHFADRVIREERVDMVAVGRAILHDPQWAAKAVEALSAGE